MPQALLIEDEIPARADLRAKLAVHPQVAIVGEAATMHRARALLARADYDLVFLDIQLIGGSAFDLVPDVRAGARVIFVTAHDAFALRAFEVNALDYLLKPVAPARLAEALRRLATTPADEGATAEDAPGAALRLDDTVFLRSGLGARFAPVAAISHIAARDNYSEVRLADGAKIFLRKSLKAWADTLPATHFMRVHRTQIVNLTHVTRYQRDADEHTLLYVAGAVEPVPASRDKWSDLRDRLAVLRRTP
ncbi:MAG: response regulator transcription factor [Verrucomicrobia bacterium]|nr:response regulator transcription factor [Verrucomicrobiota bacterium]